VLRRIRTTEWETIAGVMAAIVAIVLHFLHLTDVNVLRVITLVLVALIFLRELRHESQWESMASATRKGTRLLEELMRSSNPSDLRLIGPTELASATCGFAERGRGTVVWFNACLAMLDSQEAFDVVLRPFIDNPEIRSIRFVLKDTEKQHWETTVVPKLRACDHNGKVEQPRWAPLESPISFVLEDVARGNGKTEALLSFWGEPFMTLHRHRSVPGYLIHVSARSELIGRLKEMQWSERSP
jgi:hypothetical protein